MLLGAVKYKPWCGCVFTSPGKYLGVHVMGQKAVGCLLKKLPNYFPKWLYHEAFPPETCDSSGSSVSLPILHQEFYIERRHLLWPILSDSVSFLICRLVYVYVCCLHAHLHAGQTLGAINISINIALYFLLQTGVLFQPSTSRCPLLFICSSPDSPTPPPNPSSSPQILSYNRLARKTKYLSEDLQPTILTEHFLHTLLFLKIGCTSKVTTRAAILRDKYHCRCTPF